MGNVGEEMAATHRARREFEADRWGHNDPRGQEPSYGRIKYITHAGGYVMARRPHCMPFVISEKLWRSFELFDKARPATMQFDQHAGVGCNIVYTRREE